MVKRKLSSKATYKVSAVLLSERFSIQLLPGKRGFLSVKPDRQEHVKLPRTFWQLLLLPHGETEAIHSSISVEITI